MNLEQTINHLINTINASQPGELIGAMLWCEDKAQDFSHSAYNRKLYKQMAKLLRKAQ